jgi:hypothetical protein
MGFTQFIALQIQNEGVINIEKDDELNLFGSRGFRFTKTTLILKNKMASSQYYDEERMMMGGGAIERVPCYLKNPKWNILP